MRQSRLGTSLVIALRKARSRSRVSASSWRAVMSIPPAMIPVVRPCPSGSGAARQKTTRLSPRRLTNVFSYSSAGCTGAAARYCEITSSRSAGSMKTSQKYRPRTASSSSAPTASTAAAFWFTILPSRSRWTKRLGTVLTSVARNMNCDRSSAWSRMFSSGSPAAEATRSIVSRSSARAGSCTRAAIGRPLRSIIVTACSGAACGSSTSRPSASTHPSRSPSRYTISSEGSCRAWATASRSGVPASSDRRIWAAAARSKRPRRTPARNDTGTSANESRNMTQVTE